MSNVTTIIKLGAAVLITVVAITIAVSLFTQGQDITKSSESDLKGISQVMSSKKYEGYNNTSVSGSSVINAIKLFCESEGVIVNVKTSSGTTKTYSKTSLYNISESSNENYINPAGTFNSVLTVNENGVVTQITFTQI